MIDSPFALPMIRLAMPEIGEEEVQAVAAVLRDGFLVQGPAVQAFEERVAGGPR